MPNRPVGPMLDELQVTVDLEENDRITEVMVITKTHDLNSGGIGINIAANPGLDWIAQMGLLKSADAILTQIAISTVGQEDA